MAVLKGQAILRELHRLQKEEAFTPDVVICHGGMGFGLFVKAFLPQVKLISYMEWYFTISNSEPICWPNTLDDQLRLETRNLPLCCRRWFRRIKSFAQLNGNASNSRNLFGIAFA